MNCAVRRACIGMMLMFGLYLNVSAATFGPGVMLTPADLTANSDFGMNVAASGNLMAAGAPLNGSGIVYVFQRSGDGWIPQAELTVNDGTSGFGTTLAMDGNTLVASGHVFVNNNGIWTLQATLPGGNVSISRDTIAIGTSTAIYIYVRNNGIWTQQAAIPLSGVSSQLVTVAVQNDTLLVGAPNTNFSSGVAYIFTRLSGSWSLQATLLPDDSASATFFGIGLSIDGNTVAIGAPGTGVFRDQPGTTYIFVGNNGVWTQQAELVGTGTPAESDFGTSLSLSGNTLLVGAYEDGDAGTADIFVRNGTVWTDVYQLAPGINGIPGPASPDQRFANAVAMDGSNTFIMGSPTFTSPSNATATFREGAVYSVTLH